MKTTSPWFDSEPDRQRYQTLTSKIMADVVVVGGGIVGIVTAYQLTQRGLRVVLLEKNHLASSDSGFTTAFVTRVPDSSLSELHTLYGADFMRRLFQATGTAQQWLRDTITAKKIDCQFVDCSSYYYSYEPTHSGLRADWAAIDGGTADATLRTDAALAKLGPDMAEAIEFKHEARYHVREFLFGLLQQPEAAGLQIFEESEVTDIRVNNNVTVLTSDGAVVAKKVVLATGVPLTTLSELKPLVKQEITFAIAARYHQTAPISDDMFWDTDEPYHYFRRLDDHTIILGGSDQSGQDPIPQGDQAPHELLQAFLKKKFKQSFSVTHRWSGSIFVSQDGLPYVATHPHYGDKVHLVMGLNGNGMVMGTLAALLTADAVTGKTNPFAELFQLKRTGVTVAKPKPRLTRSPRSSSRWLTPLLRWLAPLLYVGLLWVPGYLFFQNRNGLGFLDGADFQTASLLLFPLVGLYAFYLCWAQFMIGSNMTALRKAIPWAETFHRTQGIFVLLFAVTHPSLIILAYGIGPYLKMEYVGPRLQLFAWLGEIQLFLIFVTVGTAILRKVPFIQKHWRKIHYFNYAILISALTHSWFIGSDTQIPPLKYLWIFFMITVGLSIIGRIYQAVRPVPATAPLSGQFVTVAKVSDLKDNQPLGVTVNDRELAIFKIKDKYYAIDNLCSHAGGPLCKGRIDGTTVECPWHRSKFDITTGAVVADPARRAQQTFVVRVQGDDLQVQV